MTNTIEATNLGPIESFSVALKSPGVTVLVAPNGSGKSILLDAVQVAARGKGKLPLRDRTRRGNVAAFGANITIGGTCRHSGEFEVTHIEGRFDLAGLVDPGLKSPVAADNARIKSLVSLTGVEASPQKFREHPSLAETFDGVVKSASTTVSDIVEMAAKIKDDYDAAARAQEDKAERETGHASALAAPPDLDLTLPHDSAELQEAYNQARDTHTRLVERHAEAGRTKTARDHAAELLKGLEVNELIADRAETVTLMEQSEAEQKLNLKSIAELENQISELKLRNKSLNETILLATSKISTVDRQLDIVSRAKKTLEADRIAQPTPDEIQQAADAVTAAAAAIEQGSMIRQAIKDIEQSAKHRKAATLARETATKYRDAGRATDEVLSNLIKCDQLRVESDGKSTRLVTDSTTRGKSIPYHDLSDGERWTIAIDIGADQVGEGGLLVISQVGWEGIDGFNRNHIHSHAVARGVYILTAEASTDPTATREIKPLGFEDAETEQIVGQQVARAQAKSSPKTVAPAAPKTKTGPLPPEPAAETKPVKPQVPTFDEDEEIPF